MSGGVDSSVAAALLVEQGYDVIGIMLRLWSEPGLEAFNRCCTPEAMGLARRVAAHLDIPFYVHDVRETFYENIVQFFMDGYAQGITPNPCMMCNRHIRFGALLQHAQTLQADFLATGHYARLHQAEDGKIQLHRAVDHSKDQSYVLSVLNQTQLAQAMFPVGKFTKPEIRAVAERFGLPTASRPDSQDLCFLAGGDYRDFLHRHRPELEVAGPIFTTEGQMLGQHNGLAGYTIGQRKGLGIAAPQPLYVLHKDLVRNALIVGTREELGTDELWTASVHWISGEAPEAPFRAEVKIRYTAREVWGIVTPLATGSAHVRFETPLRDITPGQAAVFFVQDQVLGNGIILPPPTPNFS
ncbi:MAG: tRNA 2-thiouridine(34) synthase MnmA [Anaerolineales bacterium]|nr:tRNA 2-thiouridine(34) synthase MnmA [Anaerolineales bacterium]